MKVRSTREIYTVIEEALEKAGGTPKTCTELYEECSDIPNHPDLARRNDDFKTPEEKRRSEINRLSDYLGHMWKREVIERHMAPPSAVGLARYAYTLKRKAWEPKLVPAPEKPKIIESKPRMTVTETEKGITIDLDSIQIFIKAK